MAKVRLLHGKPLIVGGKVALNDDCCCGGVFPSDCGNIPDIIPHGFGGSGSTISDAIADAEVEGEGAGSGLESTSFCVPGTCFPPDGRCTAFFGYYRWTTGPSVEVGSPLVIGTRYYIWSYAFSVPDDFTNVGGTNASDTFFVATGTTPNVWVASLLIEDSGRIITAGCQLRWLEIEIAVNHDVNGCIVFCSGDPCNDMGCILGTAEKSYTWDGSTRFSDRFDFPPATSESSKIFGPFCTSHPAVWAPATPT